VEYADGLSLMRLASECLRASRPPETDWLFLLEHPPVLTLGRGADGANIVASPDWLRGRGFEVHETDRGPGQCVAYPVLDLSTRPDVRQFVSDLEEAMIRTCSDWGVTAGRHPEHRGAWVGAKKIGAVGVHLSRWITTHGIALNVATDLSHFQAIVPCGIADPRLGVTSIQAEVERLGRSSPSVGDVEERLAAHLADLLGRRREDRPFDLRTVSVAPVRADGWVLLLRRTEARGGFWQQVTGRMEPGESAVAAARRELREETGIDVPVEPLGYRHGFGIDPSLLGSKEPELRTVEEEAFAVRVPAATGVTLSAEHCEYAWLPPREAEGRVRFAGLRKAIQMATGAPGPG
jgi:lipoyl(octanoyl) transferase